MDQIVLEKSSIQSLAKRQAHHTRPHQLLRKAFGDSLLANHSNITVVPSSMDPEPDTVLYFSGGYTTQKYHYSAKNNKKGLDVVQIEIPKELRHTEKGRQYVIDAVVYAIITISENYYLKNSRM
jgi:hypothetical protein